MREHTVTKKVKATTGSDLVLLLECVCGKRYGNGEFLLFPNAAEPVTCKQCGRKYRLREGTVSIA